MNWFYLRLIEENNHISYREEQVWGSRSSFVRYFTQHGLVVRYRRFGTTFRYHLQG